MKYIIDNLIIDSDIVLNESNGYAHDDPKRRVVLLSEEQITFYIANPKATPSEVLAMQLNPPPEPIKPDLTPSIEERIDAIEGLLQEMIL